MKILSISVLLFALFLFYLVAPDNSTAGTGLTTELVTNGLSRPIFVTHAPSDSTRLFIVEQTGRIIILHPAGQKTTFLNLTSKVNCCGEEGLLGLAFHPDYENNGYFYVNYTSSMTGSRKTHVERYKVSSNPDIADIDSVLSIITITQPQSNHNGGMIAFSPIDGYLYIGMGDGGGFNDLSNNSQNPQKLLGKMLRIDVDSTSGSNNYVIPTNNPFATAIDTLPEIWAIGLRNPWRFSFDKSTGDMYIGDVGQNLIEEIDFQSSSSSGGENYGWRLKEGLNCFNPPSDCDTFTNLTDPISQYTHSIGVSVTGGFVYRGCAIPDLDGTYFFADYGMGRIWSYKYNGFVISDSTERTSELNLGSILISSFGQDYFGEVYIVEYDASNGKVHKIVPDGVPSQCSIIGCCIGLTGNVDFDILDNVDIGDLTSLIDYLFISGIPPVCPEEAEMDLVSGIDIGDVTALIDFLFVNLTPLPPCP